MVPCYRVESAILGNIYTRVIEVL